METSMKIKMTILAISITLLIGAGWYGYHVMSATQSSLPVAPLPESLNVQVVNGETVVMVGAEVQKASHMVVQPVSTSANQPEITAYATVIDLQPLFDLRSSYASARTDLENARKHANESRMQYERRIQFQDGQAVSRESLENIQVVMQTDQATRQSAETILNSLDATLRQRFGNVLAKAVISPHSTISSHLLSGQAAILRITLPTDYSIPAEQITVDGTHSKPILARRLSTSPQIDPTIQGTPYLYMIEDALPVGFHTIAHVPLNEKSTTGSLIPENAIVWYGGQSWVYIKTNANHFTRRYVPTKLATSRGFVVASGINAGDEVVTSGAQLLLSEELRPQGIAAQQCKDPPECDN
jgi:multidrug efflux system membrane fusion protein